MFFKLQEMKGYRREHLQNGPGGAMFYPCIAPGEKPGGSRLKMVARIELDPGAAVGEHEHAGDEEVYIALFGEGRFTDDETVHEVAPGDVMITLDGHRHSLENTGNEPFVFVAVIAE